jgi:trk system potassium uptake protein TrkH
VNTPLDLRILGWLLVGLGAVQGVPLALAWLLGEPTLPFVASAATAAAFGLALALAARPESPELRLRDGFLVVSLSWLLASTFGALPYLLSGALGPLDAFFETVSGFTTTGSSVMSGLDRAPRGLLLWRAMTQGLGGLGIVVVAVAIAPMLGVGGMQLFRTEMPGLASDKLRPRIATTARRLLLVYAGLNAACILAYVLAGMSVFDAVCHALPTISTGGFGTRDVSFAAFASPALEWIASIFMLLGGINFTLHYRLLTGHARRVFANAELRYFLGLVAVTSLAIAWLLARAEPAPPGALRAALFQVASIVTTTGFASADFETWPAATGVILLLLMIAGGMAGSTAGGIKGLRVVLGFNVLRNSLARMLHPRMVLTVKYGDHTVATETLTDLLAFLIAYFTMALVGTTVVAFAGYDLVTSVSAALTSLGNVGPGLGAVGPMDNFAHLPGYAKLTLSGLMLAGRLEIFVLLVLLQRSFWRS